MLDTAYYYYYVMIINNNCTVQFLIMLRYLYWGQSSQTPGIFRAGLDGSNIEVIADNEVEHPTAMTIGE